MEQKKNKVQKADAKSVSKPIAKPLVVRSPKLLIDEIYIESNGKNIKVSNRVLFVTNIGQINIPIVYLFDFVKSVLQKTQKDSQAFILSD